MMQCKSMYVTYAMCFIVVLSWCMLCDCIRFSSCARALSVCCECFRMLRVVLRLLRVVLRAVVLRVSRALRKALLLSVVRVCVSVSKSMTTFAETFIQVHSPTLKGRTKTKDLGTRFIVSKLTMFILPFYLNGNNLPFKLPLCGKSKGGWGWGWVGS